jgi:hypothetical protein
LTSTRATRRMRSRCHPACRQPKVVGDPQTGIEDERRLAVDAQVDACCQFVHVDRPGAGDDVARTRHLPRPRATRTSRSTPLPVNDQPLALILAFGL